MCCLDAMSCRAASTPCELVAVGRQGQDGKHLFDSRLAGALSHQQAPEGGCEGTGALCLIGQGQWTLRHKQKMLQQVQSGSVEPAPQEGENVIACLLRGQWSPHYKKRNCP